MSAPVSVGGVVGGGRTGGGVDAGIEMNVNAGLEIGILKRLGVGETVNRFDFGIAVDGGESHGLVGLHEVDGIVRTGGAGVDLDEQIFVERIRAPLGKELVRIGIDLAEELDGVGQAVAVGVARIGGSGAVPIADDVAEVGAGADVLLDFVAEAVSVGVMPGDSGVVSYHADWAGDVGPDGSDHGVFERALAEGEARTLGRVGEVSLKHMAVVVEDVDEMAIGALRERKGGQGFAVAEGFEALEGSGNGKFDPDRFATAEEIGGAGAAVASGPQDEAVAASGSGGVGEAGVEGSGGVVVGGYFVDGAVGGAGCEEMKNGVGLACEIAGLA